MLNHPPDNKPISEPNEVLVYLLAVAGLAVGLAVCYGFLCGVAEKVVVEVARMEFVQLIR